MGVVGGFCFLVCKFAFFGGSGCCVGVRCVGVVVAMYLHFFASAPYVLLL